MTSSHRAIAFWVTGGEDKIPPSQHVVGRLGRSPPEARDLIAAMKRAP
ncbi:MAG: hypothetical protein M3Q71_22240 [Chloroflexota bacterium]|nr:hypothetical protein [Chloroflexota bacterium]